MMANKGIGSRFFPTSFGKASLIVVGVTLFALACLHIRDIRREPVNLWTESAVSADTVVDCGIVLTGAPGRIREGYELLEQKKIRKLIVSGVYRETTYHEVFPYWPYYGRVNPDDVILEKRSQTTFGNAHQSVVLAETLRCRDVYLITSQLHMPRAYKVFREVFPDTITIKKLTLPNAKSEQSAWSYIVEVVKSIFYSALSLVNIFNF